MSARCRRVWTEGRSLLTYSAISILDKLRDQSPERNCSIIGQSGINSFTQWKRTDKQLPNGPCPRVRSVHAIIEMSVQISNFSLAAGFVWGMFCGALRLVDIEFNVSSLPKVQFHKSASPSAWKLQLFGMLKWDLQSQRRNLAVLLSCTEKAEFIVGVLWLKTTPDVGCTTTPRRYCQNSSSEIAGYQHSSPLTNDWRNNHKANRGEWGHESFSRRLTKGWKEVSLSNQCGIKNYIGQLLVDKPTFLCNVWRTHSRFWTSMTCRTLSTLEKRFHAYCTM